MKELSLKKKLTIIKLYFNGLSYDSIARKTLVSKGAVSNVVSEFKAGELSNSLTVANDIDTLRELSVSLKKHSLVPGQALIGISVINMLKEMNIEPYQIQQCANLYSSLEKKEHDMESLLSIANDLAEEYESTGFTFKELEENYRKLQSEVDRLTSLSQEVRRYEERINRQNNNVKDLKRKLAKRAGEQASLNQSITEKEKQHEKLINKIVSLESRLLTIEQRSKELTQNIDKLASLGIKPADLAVLVKLLEQISLQRNIRSSVIIDIARTELAKLDDNFNLDEKLKVKRTELANITKTIKNEKAKAKRLSTKNDQLAVEQANRQATLDQQKSYYDSRIAKAKLEFDKTLSDLNITISAEITTYINEIKSLKTAATEAGIEEGKLDTLMKANVVSTDLISIAVGNFNGSPINLKKANLIFLHGLLTLLEKNKDSYTVPGYVLMHLTDTVKSMQLWHPNAL